MKNNLIQMIATRAASSDFFAFFNYLPNPDPVLKRMGKDISAYREILSDAHVGGCVRRRKAAVKALEWRLTPTGNATVDEQLERIFSHLPISQIISEILDASLFGYQVLEVMWQVDNGLFVPQLIQGKPQEWFVFDHENQLRFRTKENRDECIRLPDKKFLLATQDASYINPYGRADLALCFWAATFKKGGFKFWLDFTEKYGAPWLVGKYPRRSEHKEIDKLMDAMQAMLGTAVVAIPDDASIEIQESASKGASSEVFQQFLTFCKSEIAIAILGQNQTTEQETNHASASAGLEVLKAIRDDDATMVERVFNQLLQWLCEFNFSVEQLPKFELFEQERIDKNQAERDEILSRCGVKFSKTYWQRTYDLEDDDLDESAVSDTEQTAFKAPVNSVQMAFNEPQNSAKSLVDQQVEQLNTETQPQVAHWLQTIQDKVQQAKSLEDIKAAIDSLIPELSYDEYATLLAKASISANFAGRYSVDQERKTKE